MSRHTRVCSQDLQRQRDEIQREQRRAHEEQQRWQRAQMQAEREERCRREQRLCVSPWELAEVSRLT